VLELAPLGFGVDDLPEVEREMAQAGALVVALVLAQEVELVMVPMFEVALMVLIGSGAGAKWLIRRWAARRWRRDARAR